MKDDGRLERIERKIDIIAEKQSEMAVSLAENRADWREHMRRTEAAEKGLALLKKSVIAMFATMVILLGDKAVTVLKFFLALPF